MPIKIDLMTMRQAVDKVRLPGEPENQGYLNRRTGEVVFVSNTEEDACWASACEGSLRLPPGHYDIFFIFDRDPSSLYHHRETSQCPIRVPTP